MSDVSVINGEREIVWERYRDNFSRHLLSVTRYLQAQTMDILQQECGHADLRLGFAPYITLIGQHGMRLTDLAEILGITRQACNQAANQIETAGYIARNTDPSDGRAKQLVLTARGVKLREDGTSVIEKLDEEFTSITSTAAIRDAGQTLGKIYTHLSLDLTVDRSNQYPGTGLGALLPRLGDYILLRLMELTKAKGHPGLKMSFAQVLTLIGESGGRIQQIAKVQHVSKQAISAIASEAEALGYLQRHPDPADARQLVLRFTARGRSLIEDSVASVDELEAEFVAIAGKPGIDRLKSTFADLYCALHLEQDIFDNSAPNNIGELAQQIQQQLGSDRSRELARLLLSPGNNRS